LTSSRPPLDGKGSWCPDREIRLVLPQTLNEFRDLKDTRKIMMLV